METSNHENKGNPISGIYGHSDQQSQAGRDHAVLQ